VFWVHAGTQARFEEGYQRIAEMTRMDGWDNPKEDVLRLVRNWLSDESNGRWAMIVDNADDSAVFFPPPGTTQEAEVEPLSDFLPQSPNGTILITSRSQDVARRLTGRGDCLIEVKPMDEDEALALLEAKLSFNVNEDDAIELLKALDYMPLAITQAAAYIEQRAPRMTVSRYLDEVVQSDYNRSSLLMKDMGDGRRDGRASNSIMTTWQISFAHIQKERPTAARLLSLMSLFDRQGIPESLLYDRYQQDIGVDGNGVQTDFEDDIHTLTNYSLVKMSADGNKFEMHRLVQFSMKTWLELSGELEGWKEVYVTLMDNNYPVGRHENWTTCQKLFPHAQIVVGYRPADVKAVEAWASVLFKVAWYASEMGKYKEAEEMSRGAFEAREAILGAEHTATLVSMNNLALVLQLQGKYEQAEDLHRRVLEGTRKALGEDHPETLTSLANLALTLKEQGKYDLAEDMNRQALEGSEIILGKEHPDTLTSLGNLALILREQGRYEQAVEMSKRALDGRKRVLGDEHPHTLMSASNLASVLRYQGKYEQAEDMGRRALEGREKTLGKEHPDTLTSASNLALVLQYQGKYEQAEAIGRRALEGRERTLGREHPDTLTSASTLAAVLRRRGKHEEAEDMHRRALEGYEQLLGKEHPATLMCVGNLALALQEQGKYEEAENMNRQALVGKEKALGKEHPETLASVYCLAHLLHQQKQYEDAVPLYQRACAGYQDKLGPDHPTTQSCLANYALLQEQQSSQALGSKNDASIDGRGIRAHSPSLLQGPAQSPTLEPTKISKRHRIFQKLVRR
jgi:tetratricopeptide (TPR) repeat protein